MYDKDGPFPYIGKYLKADVFKRENPYDIGENTSSICLKCGKPIKYWAVESPLYGCQCDDLRYSLAVGCKYCMDQIITLINEEQYNCAKDIAEVMAKDVLDYQRRHLND